MVITSILTPPPLLKELTPSPAGMTLIIHSFFTRKILIENCHKTTAT